MFRSDLRGATLRGGRRVRPTPLEEKITNDLQRFDLNPELPKFKFPTLVVTGRYDFNVAPSVAWAIHHAIPGSELAVFEKSGHLPQCEESAKFAERLEAFLSKR